MNENQATTQASPALSPDQERAVALLEAAVADPQRKEFALGGLAGTGKSFVLAHVVDRRAAQRKQTLVVAPTAKACVVLRRKGVDASTIHSAIYDFRGVAIDTDAATGEQKQRMEFSRKEASAADRTVVVCDEASMVTADVADDLRRRAAFVVWVGDYGQLPPVGTDPGIMSRLSAKLERVHRQAAGSHIIDIAHEVRGGADLRHAIPPIHDTEQLGGFDCYSEHGLAEIAVAQRADAIIVARNETRASVNLAMRRLSKRDPTKPIVPGERLVGLKNHYPSNIVNGELYDVLSVIKEDEVAIEVTARDSLGFTVSARVAKMALGKGKVDLAALDSLCKADRGVAVLDYGYCLTCHKAQGSEWDRVLVLNERVYRETWDYTRWAYTAATRAAKWLGVVGDSRRGQR